MIKRLFSMAWLLACWLAVGAPVAYFVDDAKGNDENPGDEKAPFRTVRRALRQYRMMAVSRCVPNGGVRIVLAPGRYEMASGITLTSEDSGDAEHPLEIDGGGQAVFSGSLVLQRSDILPVADEAVLKRLRVPSLSSNLSLVFGCDLTKYGVAQGLPPKEKSAETPLGELYVINGIDEFGRLSRLGRLRRVKRLEQLVGGGRWCIEPDDATLYVMPAGGGAKESPLELSRLTVPFFTLEKCSGVRFRNLTFECSLSDGVVIDGDDNQIEGCVFRNLAGTGVVVRGKRNVLQSIEVHESGTEGLSVVENADNVVRDCRLHHNGKEYSVSMDTTGSPDGQRASAAAGEIPPNAGEVRNGKGVPQRQLAPRGRFTAAVAKGRVDVNGQLLKEEWGATAVCGRVRIETLYQPINSYVSPIEQMGLKRPEAMPAVAVKRGPPCTLYVMAGTDGLYAAFDVVTTGANPLVTAGGWGAMEEVGLQFCPSGSSVMTVYKGLISGKFRGEKVSDGANADMSQEVVQGVRYAAKVLGDAHWRCEWFIPWEALGGRPAAGTAIGFNALVRQKADNRCLMWRINESPETYCAGELIIP